jgi:hypothetical protein
MLRQDDMTKTRINLSLDSDLMDFVKEYAESQRTTVSEVFTQFALKLKRDSEHDPTEIILADPAFTEALLKTMEQVRQGASAWRRYDEVFR